MEFLNKRPDWSETPEGNVRVMSLHTFTVLMDHVNKLDISWLNLMNFSSAGFPIQGIVAVFYNSIFIKTKEL